MSVNLGPLWGGGEGLEKGEGQRCGGEVGIPSFTHVCPQHLLLEEMDEMGNWPPPE